MPRLRCTAALVVIAAFELLCRVFPRLGRYDFELIGPQQHRVRPAVMSPAIMAAGRRLQIPAAPITVPPADPVDGALRRLEAAIRAAGRISDADDRADALANACVQWARYDPRNAMALARELRVDHINPDVLSDIVQQWAGANAPAALGWVNQQPVGGPRDAMLSRVAFVWSKSQPTEAARLVAERISPGPAQEEAAISVMHQWALRDFPAAQAWADRFPAGEVRDRALAELAMISREVPSR